MREDGPVLAPGTRVSIATPRTTRAHGGTRCLVEVDRITSLASDGIALIVLIIQQIGLRVVPIARIEKLAAVHGPGPSTAGRRQGFTSRV
jgi:hypothetical protein